MDGETCWDEFKHARRAVRTDTRDDRDIFNEAAAQVGIPIASTGIDLVKYPWAVYYDGGVSGWTGRYFAGLDKAKKLTFEEWQDIMQGAPPVVICAADLENIL